jgi:hypothetical protein
MDKWNMYFDLFDGITMDEWEKEMAIIPRHADLKDTALNDLEKSRNGKKTQLRYKLNCALLRGLASRE